MATEEGTQGGPRWSRADIRKLWLNMRTLVEILCSPSAKRIQIEPRSYGFSILSIGTPRFLYIITSRLRAAGFLLEI